MANWVKSYIIYLIIRGVIVLKIIRHKTPTEECFLSWITNHPESFHELDERRFYQFTHCVFSYNAKSWLNKEYFRKRILELKPNFQINNIDEFYNRLLILKKYNESWKLDCITTILDDDGYIQRHIINNAIREVIITEDEYNHNGISKKEFINRLGASDKQN